MTTKHEVEIGNLNDQLQSVLRLVRQAVEEHEWEIAEACYRRLENMAQKAIGNLYRIQFPSSEPESASKLISFEPIEETDDHSTIASFCEYVRQGYVTSDDGFGVYATKDQKSSLHITSLIHTREEAPSWATHVVWYNK